jgi:copper chaperone CopZ
VERALEELPGVLEVHADLKSKRVRMIYRPEDVSTGAMTGAINRVDLRLSTRLWVHRLVAWLR